MSKLRARLHGSLRLTRLSAALALMHLGEGTAALQEELADEDPAAEVDAEFLEELEGFPDESRAVLPALISLLDPRSDGSNWAQILKLLGEVGADARSAGPAIRRLVTMWREFRSDEANLNAVIDAAADALRKIESAPSSTR